jgi:hypothetical protein
LIARALRIDVDYDDNRSRTTVRINRQADTTRVETQQRQEKKKLSRSSKLRFNLDLGLNNFVNSQPFVNPADPLADPINYDLRPLGSRYISFNTHVEPRIGGQNSPLHLRSGLELAFNNFMFDRNISLRQEGDQTIFYEEQDRLFQKSKLAMSSINLPLMMMLKFRNNRGGNAFTIGAGGFVGHRLGSHTKVKYPENGRTNKDKERSNFYLNDVQYGANVMVGFGSLRLFGKYNLNPLFRENRGPETNVVSFGLTLFH